MYIDFIFSPSFVPPHTFPPHHFPAPQHTHMHTLLSRSHQSLQAEMPADANKWRESPLSESPSVCVAQIEFHKCNQRGSVMKDPEWPVYYFRQHAEGTTLLPPNADRR